MLVWLSPLTLQMSPSRAHLHPCWRPISHQHCWISCHPCTRLHSSSHCVCQTNNRVRTEGFNFLKFIKKNPFFFFEFGVNRCKLLQKEWINNKDLLYSTGKYIHYSQINHNKKEYIYIYIYIYKYTNHFAVQKKLTQHCKSTILRFRKTLQTRSLQGIFLVGERLNKLIYCTMEHYSDKKKRPIGPNKLVHCTMEYYTVIKRKDLLGHKDTEKL